MAESMLMSKVVMDQWRDCLLTNKVDIFEFIKKMIKLAANHRPAEFSVKRSNILDTLYSCEVAAASKQISVMDQQDQKHNGRPLRSLKIRIKLKKPEAADSSSKDYLAKAPATPQQKLEKISIQSLNNNSSIAKPISEKVEHQKSLRCKPRDSDMKTGDQKSTMEKKLDLSKRKLQMRYNEVECMKQKRKVSDEGDVLYVFPNDYRSKLIAKSFRIRAEPYIEKAKSGGEYLIRVTFGTALIASILIVFTAIIAILTSSRY